MVELLRSNDVVYLSWVQSVLDGAGIPCLMLDEHTSSIEGSIGAIQRRLVVAKEDRDAAQRLLIEAEAGDRAP
jgi:hypothetical protein